MCLRIIYRKLLFVGLAVFTIGFAQAAITSNNTTWSIQSGQCKQDSINFPYRSKITFSPYNQSGRHDGMFVAISNFDGQSACSSWNQYGSNSAQNFKGPITCNTIPGYYIIRACSHGGNYNLQILTGVTPRN